MSIIEKTEEFQRTELADLLNACTEEQQAFFFNRIFPNGVSEDNLISAIQLVERTLAKNNA